MGDEEAELKIKEAIFAWVRDDTGSAIQMTIDHRKCEKLASRILSAIDLPSIKAAARAEALEEAAKAAEKYAPFRGYSIEKNGDYGWATARERIAETLRSLAKATE